MQETATRATAISGLNFSQTKRIMKTTALILSGGSSSRMKGTDKQFALIGGVPVIAKSLLAFQDSEEVDDIIVAAKEEGIGKIKALSEEYGITKLRAVVKGGKSRTESAFNAFKAAEKCDIIFVHDGARPFVDDSLIERVKKGAVEYGCAVPVIPVKDTIKVTENGFVKSTPDRSTLSAVQTPQGFRYEIYEKIISEDAEATDDSGLAEKMGYRVRTVEGSEKNIKITVPEDLAAVQK